MASCREKRWGRGAPEPDLRLREDFFTGARCDAELGTFTKAYELNVLGFGLRFDPFIVTMVFTYQRTILHLARNHDATHVYSGFCRCA
jgi:hypothetical protein